MTCRDEILDCVLQIISKKGENTFSIVEILNCMKARGTKYKNSTIRTHITSRMCSNAPKHHAVKYNDFKRTSRGSYKLKILVSFDERPPKTLKQLYLASKHFYYEIWMLWECFGRMNNLKRSNGKVIEAEKSLENALLESFLIHARVVSDFFFVRDRVEGIAAQKKIRLSDVIAEDFFESYETWWDICPPKTKWLNKVNPRTGREVAHLTYNRQYISEVEKQWHTGQIFLDIWLVFNIFIDAVKDIELDSRLELLRKSIQVRDKKAIIIQPISNTQSL